MRKLWYALNENRVNSGRVKKLFNFYNPVKYVK